MNRTGARKLGAVAAAAGAGVLVAASPASAAPPTATMTATPATNLADGQTVNVVYDTGVSCTVCIAPYDAELPLGPVSDVHFIQLAFTGTGLVGPEDLGQGTGLTLTIDADGHYTYQGQVKVKRVMAGNVTCVDQCVLWMAQYPVGTAFPQADPVALTFTAPK